MQNTLFYRSRVSRGFTLIELLVVIAIIGILSSIILTSLNSARNKGNNAKMKSQLALARSGAEIYYTNQTPNSYTGMCSAASTETYIYPYLQGSSYPGTPTVTCYATSAGYNMSVPLSVAEGTNTHWCIDSNGNSKGRTSAAPTSGTPGC